MERLRFRSVKNLNNYIELTEYLCNEHKNVDLNSATLDDLKVWQCFEIEHFNKCDDKGAAFIIMQRLLAQAPSIAWGYFAKDLVLLIEYWLNAVLKHLLSHHRHWWTFVKHLLDFVKELMLKHKSIINILVENISGSFLDLACREQLGVSQRHEVLHTFNLFCANSSQSVRNQLRPQFEAYFVKLAAIMSSCGYVPLQYSVLEALLRWLLRRGDVRARLLAAADWFPPHRYCRRAVQLFIDTNWRNFFMDAREFLNAHNQSGLLVTSVICSKLSVGDIVFFEQSKKQFWLDINTANSCISVMLDPQTLSVLDIPVSNCCQSLVVGEDITEGVRLSRLPGGVTIVVRSARAPALLPSHPHALLAAGGELRLEVRPPGQDPLEVHRALRACFGDKYQEEDVPLSCLARDADRDEISDQPPAVVGLRQSEGRSSTSSSSLAQLQVKLAALPSCTLGRKRVPLLKQSDLPQVAECTEPSATASTLKLNPWDIVNSSDYRETARKSQSDSEVVHPNVKTTGKKVRANDEIGTFEVFNRDSETRKVQSCDELEVNNNPKSIDETSVSLLGFLMIGSNDQSVINDTFEKVSKSKNFTGNNFMGCLDNEALQYETDRYQTAVSGVNTENQQAQESCDVIENTNVGKEIKSQKKSMLHTVSMSTSDESNTEEMTETPISYVADRKKNIRRIPTLKKTEPNNATYTTINDKVVEDFFAQHLAENKGGDLIISPTSAKKISETSSESDDMDRYLISNMQVNTNIQEHEHPDIDIVNCLNDMIDEVCNEVEKCVQYLNREESELGVESIPDNLDNIRYKGMASLKKIGNTNDEMKGSGSAIKATKDTEIKQQNIKLKYKVGKKKASKQQKPVKNRLHLETTTTNMYTIIKATNKVSDVSAKNGSSPFNDLKTPLVRRKRKLYSPKDDITSYKSKDDQIDNDEAQVIENEEQTHIEVEKYCVTPKEAATRYIDIEKDKRKFRKKRTVKSKAVNSSPMSPNTERSNVIFDNLKQNIENAVKITLVDTKTADELAVYNFTSESEDEDFKHKKMEIQKRVSLTAAHSGHSFISTRSKTKSNKMKNSIENIANVEPKKKVPFTRRKRASKRHNLLSKKQEKIDPIRALADERIRATASEVLETSFVVEKLDQVCVNEEPDPAILVPEVELITVEVAAKELAVTTPKKNKSNKKMEITVKKEKAGKQIPLQNLKDIDGDGNISPLPGLVVETMPKEPSNADDSLTSNLVQKLKKIYKEGPDALNETNTTHHLLSEYEGNNVTLPMTEMFNEILADNRKKEKRNSLKAVDGSTTRKKCSPASDIEVTLNPDEKSIASSNSGLRRYNLQLTKKKSIKQSRLPTVKQTTEPTLKIIRLKGLECKQTTTARKQSVEIVGSKSNYNKNGSSTADSEVKRTKRSDIADISDVTDTKDEKSIATDGITAHGDLSEDPPCIKTFRHREISRELVDMDESVKEYYLQLREQTHISNHSSSDKSNSNEMTQPIVSIQRISSDEISRLLFSGDDYLKKSRNINTGINATKRLLSPKYSDSKVSSKSDCDISKHGRELISPTVSVKKMSLAELNKWLPSNTDSGKSGTSKVNRFSKQCDKIAISIDSDSIVAQDHVTPEIHSSNDNVRKGKSLISPININEFFSTNPSRCDTSIRGADRFKITTNKDRAIPKKIATRDSSPHSKCTSTNTHRSPILRTPVPQTRSPKEVKRLSLISPIASLEQLICTKRGNQIDSKNTSSESGNTSNALKRTRKPNIAGKLATTNVSPVSVLATSRELDDCRSLSENTKRRRLGETKGKVETYAASRPSASSVADWLEQNAVAGCRAQQGNASVADALDIFMERLDTTLNEIHEDTSKNYVRLFVDVQRRQTEMREEVRAEYRRSVGRLRETFSAVLAQMEERLAADLEAVDKWTQEKDAEFTCWMKQRATDLLRRDCKRKHDLMTLLKEDVEATRGHGDRQGTCK